MRVAVVHYWFVANRGGEKVIEEILRIFPDADIFTHVYDAERGPDFLRGRDVTETWISRLPGARRRYQSYLPLMPRALEDLDLSGYDLVISSEAGPAKGVIAHPNATHVCYCHSPMRYLYDQRETYLSEKGMLGRSAYSVFAHGLRQWDFVSAQRLDAVVANSNFVAKRIKRAWGLDSSVVHPPVDVARFANAEAGRFPGGLSSRGVAPKTYFLVFGEVAPYKRVDLATAACRLLGLPLVVAGEGKGLAAAQRAAGPETLFLGRVGDHDVPGLLAGAKALLLPGEEDFGIVPLEAAAAGTPTIAYGSGGVTDTVLPDRTGLFFREQTVSSLSEALQKFEGSAFSAKLLREWASSFRPEEFRSRFSNAVYHAIEEKRAISKPQPLPLQVARAAAMQVAE